MPRFRPRLTLLAASLVLGLVQGADAQIFYAQDEPFSVTPVAPSGPVVAAPVVAATPFSTRGERRAARRQNRYQTMRPTYSTTGQGLTFAPFSDRYYPRTVFARDQPTPVYTTTRSFAR